MGTKKGWAAKVREAWQDIRRVIGLGPLTVVAGYGAVAFGVFALGMNDVTRALTSAVYSLLMLFVWLILIGYCVRSSGLGQIDGKGPPLDVRRPRRELAILLAILAIHALFVSWVWLGPVDLRWPSWVVALVALYGLSMWFMRSGGYGPEHIGLDLRGNWKGYLLAIIAQMFLAMGLSQMLPARLWRSDLLAGLVAIVVVSGLLGALASPLMGRWRLGLSGIAADLQSLKPFAGLLALLMVSQVVGSIVLVGDPSVLTRPLFPLNGYFAQGPVPEEIYYRGLLQTRLQAVLHTVWPTRWPVGWAILLTGLAFTAMHIPSHIASGADIAVELLDFTGGFANAFAAGYLYYRARNLAPAIVFHSLSFL